MNKKQLDKAKQKILKRIRNSDNFAILVSDPDNDSIGSGLAMEEILVQMGKKCKLYSSFELPEFTYLPRFKRFIIKDVVSINFKRFKTLIVLDSGDPSRLVDKKIHAKGFEFPRSSFIINIDHHDTTTLFGNINYIPANPIISSTAEALYDIFSDKITITPSLATNLLSAIIGDTGNFRYSNTSPATLRVAAELMERKANHRSIIKNIFYSFRPDIVKINIDAIKQMKFKKVGKYKFVYTIIDIKKFGFTNAIGNQLYISQEVVRSIYGVNFTLRITPLEKKLTKLSFRSKDREIVKIAEHFGGGGHKESAGAIAPMSVDECLKKLTEFLQKTKLPKVL